MKAFILLCALVALASAAGLKKERSRRSLEPGTVPQVIFDSYGNSQKSEALAGNSVYGTSWESSKTGLEYPYGRVYAPNYGFALSDDNKDYVYPAPLTRYDYSVPSYESYYSIPYTYYTSNEYVNSVSPPNYYYTVPTKSYSVTRQEPGPSVSIHPSVGYTLPSTAYVEPVQYPAKKVITVKKVVNVQREVLVPKVIQVKKIITEPKIITQEQVVPVVTTYPSKYDSSFSNVYAGSSYSNSDFSPLNKVYSSSNVNSAASSSYSSVSSGSNGAVTSSSSVVL